MTTAERLQRQRDRCIAIVLSLKERDVDAYLPAPVSAKLRKVILDQLNEFHEAACDIIASAEGRAVPNTLYDDKLDQLFDDVTAIRRMLDDRVA
jgi:hypothetical protein